MTDQAIIEKTIAFVKSEIQGAEGGHDWFHIERVWKNARTIAQAEPVNLFVVELGALLHDIADYNFNDEPDGIKRLLIKIISLLKSVCRY